MIRKGKNGALTRRQRKALERARKNRWARRVRAIARLQKIAPNMVPALAVVGSYEELISVLVEHRGKLGLSQLAVDDLAGFHSGYTGKLEVGTKAKCGRGLGRMSLPTLLDTYGLRLAVVEKAI